MGNVRRIFVEKRVGMDVLAQKLRSELTNTLDLPIKNVRILQRYDIEGIQDEATFDDAKRIIFAEPNADIITDALPAHQGAAFAVEYLPGQYDQRADSASQCAQLITRGERPRVAHARVYILEGDLSDAQIARAQAHLINPVDSRLAAEAVPDTLEIPLDEPDAVQPLTGFIHLDSAGIRDMHKDMGLAMSVEDLAFCQAHFANEGRDPFVTEIRVIDTYWSDHCRHTTFLTQLDEISVPDGVLKLALEQYRQVRAEVYGDKAQTRPETLMDMATIGAKALKRRGMAPDLDESEEINACSIHVNANVDGSPEDWLIMFKNETHNHPTEIEPFGGAATCLGGAIRDPLSGRSYVYQAMRVTGSGDPRTPVSETLKNKLPQRAITNGAAAGYSAYGNQIGLATGSVHEFYHPGYVAKRLEIGAVIGAAPKANVVRESPAAGDIIVLLGGRTGRDGIGGATGSSKAHTASSLTQCGAEVQKGNPPTERKLQRLFRDPKVSRKIKRCNDFGAGGVCVAIGELAPGLEIDLSQVPKKYEGLDGTELAISESQERMAVVIDPKDVEFMLAAADRENLEATPVAVVRGEPRLVMRWRGQTVVDIPRAFLDTNGVTQHACAQAAMPTGDAPTNHATGQAETTSASDLLRSTVSQLNTCLQRGLVERFDSTIGAASVLMPYGGKYQATESQVMAARLPVDGRTTTITLMSYGFDPELSTWSPFHGAVNAILESVARIVCAGGKNDSVRLTLQEYFERLRQDPARWGKPTSALLGALHAQLALGIPAIGGKDSMSGSFEQLDVPPTLVSFAVCALGEKDLCTNVLQASGHELARLSLPEVEPGLPNLDAARTLYAQVHTWICDGKIASAQAIGAGGLAAALVNMASGNRVGVKLCGSPDDLFAPRYGDLVFELAESVKAGDLDCDALTTVGTTCDTAAFELTLNANERCSVPLEELQALRESVLEDVFPTRVDREEDERAFADLPPRAPVVTRRPEKSNSNTAHDVCGCLDCPNHRARPQVVIPVFPGTNCELDTARAFERAGADAQCIVFNNSSPRHIEESVKTLASAINQSQILMLPGGFSAGDEPEGSGKFIAAVLRNSRVSEAVMNLMQNRDGLIMGICNGFQALVKVGLLPYGEIRTLTEDDPTLTFNPLGRHVSCLVDVRVTSNASPWQAHLQPGDIRTVAVSHGEGRFVAGEAQIRALYEAGQVATQYVGPDGRPTSRLPWNPNGSAWAVEGLISPDGRIFGRMGHTERTPDGVCRNVPALFDQGLFASGVAYFA